jgi:ParB family chromosome partitioning protein
MGQSIMMKRKEALREMLAPITDRPAPDSYSSKRPVKPGSLKAMGLSLRSLTDEAAEAEALRARMENGDLVIDIDPQLIAPSFISDRLLDGGNANLADLEASIAETGQQVPILVRPMPGEEGRYQVAYGHRRVEVCRRLRRPVKAIVRPLTDQELVTAQGKENLEREDLSFIERALFAARLEDRGFDRSVLMAALGVHKGNLSTMISVARAVPEELIIAIGPAPKIGRPRWEQLVELLRNRTNEWKALVEASDLDAMSSDARFARVLKALSPKTEPEMSRFVKDAKGQPVAQFEQTRDRVRLTIDNRSTAAFGAYLIDHLPEIYAAYQRRMASEPREFEPLTEGL